METTAPLDLADTTVFARDRNASIQMLLISAVFVGIGIWFILGSETFADSSLSSWIENHGVSPTLVLAGLSAIAIALGLAAGSGWLRHRRNAALNPCGLSIDAGTLKVSDIPWSEVTGTQRVSITGQNMLGIVVATPEQVISEQGRAGRLTARMNARNYQTPVYVPASMMTDPLDRLDAAVHTYGESYGDA